MLRELVIKIFPQVFDSDKEDERRFYESIGAPLDEPLPSPGKRDSYPSQAPGRLSYKGVVPLISFSCVE